MRIGELSGRSPIRVEAMGSGRHRGRRPPSLWILLPLEGGARIILDAETYEDELRLRQFLRRSRAMERLPEIIPRLLDDLDGVDAKAA